MQGGKKIKFIPIHPRGQNGCKVKKQIMHFSIHPFHLEMCLLFQKKKKKPTSIHMIT